MPHYATRNAYEHRSLAVTSPQLLVRQSARLGRILPPLTSGAFVHFGCHSIGHIRLDLDPHVNICDTDTGQSGTTSQHTHTHTQPCHTSAIDLLSRQSQQRNSTWTHPVASNLSNSELSQEECSHASRTSLKQAIVK